ncbi:MAG: 23S rRNA (uracil(1939)-C(5))-methyltransferase RlmD [Bacteroidetes bacterium]|nr:MAG: 23S rRNA (uracil(1939)-C(5))-methyltransferase RlmD [Bacteroidota bacterium]
MKRGDVLELRITDYSLGGKGICKLPTEQGELVVFVENSFPGQLVRARISKKRKRHIECKLLDIIERAPIEQALDYQEISGAPYIFVPVAEQESMKKESSLTVFRKLANVQDIHERFDRFISSPKHFNYRNKMEYSFSSIEHDLESNEEKDHAFALGSKRRGTWWKVESLNKESGMFDQELENKLHLIRTFLEKTGLPAWHPPQKTGFFRHLLVRKSFHQDQLLINLVTSSEGLEQFNVQEFSAFLQELLGKRLAGFRHTVNDDVADRAKIENGSSQLVFGENKLIEQLNDLFFEISMESFFQTNPASASLLYEQALNYVFEDLDLSGKVVMDLFCGTGTIGQLLARRSPESEIIGVDIVPEAIQNAQENARYNKIEKVRFYAADVGKFLFQYPEYAGKIACIVLDPPRAGIAPKTLQKIIQLGAERIVYISCNPATQARDTDTLMSAGYDLKKLSLVDQFPHTSHIESIAQFVRIGD